MKIPTSNAKTLDGIRVRKQNRNFNAVKKRKKVVGIDTEKKFRLILLLYQKEGLYQLK